MKHEKSKNDAMRHELDHIDAKILNLLRENARMPLKEIAEHVFLAGAAHRDSGLAHRDRLYHLPDHSGCEK